MVRFVDHWEELSLAIVFFFSFYGHYLNFNSQLRHDVPLLYAADPTWHSLIAEYFADSGLVKYRPSYFALGRTDIEWFHPIVLMHTLAAYLTQMTPLEAWDALWLVVTLAHIFTAFGVYMIVKRLFGSRAAVLSFALVSFPWKEVWFYPYTIGLQPNIVGMFYLPFLFYMGLKLKDGLHYPTALFTGLLLTLVFFSHASEFFLAMGYYAVLLAYSRLDRPLLKNLGLSLLVFLVLSFYFLPLILLNTFSTTGGMLSKLGTSLVQEPYEPTVEFGLGLIHIFLLPFLFIGFKVIADSFTQKETRDYLLLALYVTFLAFFSNYIGFPTYANFRFRYFYYMVLYPFAGIGFSHSLAYLRNRHGLDARLGTVALSCILVFIPVFILQPVSPGSEGLIDEQTFEGFMFLKENTPPDSDVLFIGFNQAEGLWSHRITYQAPIGQLQSDLKNGILRMLWTDVIAEGFLYRLPVRTGLFSIEPTFHGSTVNVSMCDTGFIMFKTFNESLNSYVGAYAEALNETHDIAFVNSNAVILRRKVTQSGCYERILRT